MVTWLAPERSGTAPAGRAASPRSPCGVLDLHAPRSWIARRWLAGLRPVRDLDLALTGQVRRVPTLQGGESPMPGSGCPVVPRDGGRNVAGPSASNAGQRPVSCRQALAYGSSLASVTVVPPRGCDRHAFRTPTATLAQGGRRRSGPARLDRRSRLSLAGRVGTLPRNRPNPQEASNDGTGPVRAARWCLRYRSGG